jgi:hypothetical protein
MTQALVKPTTEKDALAILASADDRELLDAAENDAFMPYDFPFQARALLVSVKAKKNYDNQGVFCTFKIVESSAPAEVRVGKFYTVAFFDVHKTLPEFVLKQHLLDKREFAAVVAKANAGDETFKAAPVLLKLHREVDSLDIPMLLENRFVKVTRNGKKVHNLRFALDQS